MEEILQQVGDLMLGALPTSALFIALVLAYQFLVQGPLSRTLEERRARTEGAIEDAHRAIAQAEARAAVQAISRRRIEEERAKLDAEAPGP